jgi:hypothetical protein
MTEGNCIYSWGTNVMILSIHVHTVESSIRLININIYPFFVVKIFKMFFSYFEIFTILLPCCAMDHQNCSYQLKTLYPFLSNPTPASGNYHSILHLNELSIFRFLHINKMM